MQRDRHHLAGQTNTKARPKAHVAGVTRLRHRKAPRRQEHETPRIVQTTSHGEGPPMIRRGTRRARHRNAEDRGDKRDTPRADTAPAHTMRHPRDSGQGRTHKRLQPQSRSARYRSTIGGDTRSHRPIPVPRTPADDIPRSPRFCWVTLNTRVRTSARNGAYTPSFQSPQLRPALVRLPL